ncbi:MAG: SixA phosphatase family protein, partial [Gammaproteobacteria bacterium]
MTVAGAARRLLVMRHAKSDWDSGAGSDFDRPLAKRGERDAPRMGRW